MNSLLSCLLISVYLLGVFPSVWTKGTMDSGAEQSLLNIFAQNLQAKQNPLRPNHQQRLIHIQPQSMRPPDNMQEEITKVNAQSNLAKFFMLLPPRIKVEKPKPKEPENDSVDILEFFSSLTESQKKQALRVLREYVIILTQMIETAPSIYNSPHPGRPIGPYNN